VNDVTNPWKRSLRRNVAGAVVVVGLLAASAVVSARLELAGAVIAGGKIVVNSEVKKVQHSTGGLIGEITVVNGQHVVAGDVVARLDATTVRANFEIVSRGLDDLYARRARLVAERDNLDHIDFGPELLSGRNAQDVGPVMASERRVFDLRQHASEGQKAQLRERIRQLHEQIVGIEKQSTATSAELALIEEELKGVRDLWAKKLIQFTRLNTLERDQAKLQGELGSQISSVAQAKGRISETELQVLQVDQDLRSDVAREVSDVDAKVSELAERKVAAQDQLSRIDMRAPQTGIVHQLAIHTIGGVIGPQETLMEIVPEYDLLAADVRIGPNDIDQVTHGQTAYLRFPAFNQRTTPERTGIIDRVSPDLIVDKVTGAQYYEARIVLNDINETFHLVPGMPVEAFLRTDERTIISYLTKPLFDSVARAFRG
jgi:HlyD family secretion protein